MAVLDGTGTQPLDLLVQQLWRPYLSDGGTRIVLNDGESARWRTHEEYWVVPSAQNARLLVPIGPTAATVGALANYRRLRRWRPRSVRAVAAVAARLAAPLSRDRLLVQQRTDGSPPPLPLATLGRVIGRRRLYASIGVRTAANRKTTLQLVDAAGVPCGFAKLAWDSVTAVGVETEAQVLKSVAGGDAAARAPELLGTGDLFGHPYVVTAPLPASAASPSVSAPMPNAQELAAIAPTVRRAAVRDTAQFAEVRAGLARLRTGSTVPASLRAAMQDLATRLEASRATLPVTERWHGDLAPWNTARDARGVLWCWDWETAQADAVAGLDSVHWAFSRCRQSATGIDRHSVRTSVAAAGPNLWAAGLPRRDWSLVAALYALTIAERTATLAARTGWAAVWVDHPRLTAVVADATSLLDADG